MLASIREEGRSCTAVDRANRSSWEIDCIDNEGCVACQSAEHYGSAYPPKLRFYTVRSEYVELRRQIVLLHFTALTNSRKYIILPVNRDRTKLDGSLAGFGECLGKCAFAIKDLQRLNHKGYLHKHSPASVETGNLNRRVPVATASRREKNDAQSRDRPIVIHDGHYVCRYYRVPR